VEKSPFLADVVYNRRMPPPCVRTSPTRPGDSSPRSFVWTGSPHFPLTHSYSFHPPSACLFFLLRHGRGAPPSLPGGVAARRLSPRFALLHHYSSQRTRLRLSPRRSNDLLSARISLGGGPIGLSIAAATHQNSGKLLAHHQLGRVALLSFSYHAHRPREVAPPLVVTHHRRRRRVRVDLATGLSASRG
jgi:hypothetical protein